MPWSDKFTGTTDTKTGEDTVTFKEKTGDDGKTTDVIVSRGENLTGDHGHAWKQDTNEPDHRNDSTGVFDDDD